MSSDFSAHNLAHLKAITETIHDAIISIDAQGRILSWNGAAENIFRYTAANALGQAITIIIPERFQKAHEGGLGGSLPAAPAT
jgi:PAS domain S-box-containing protein